MSVRIVGLGGSRRNGSASRAALRHALASAAASDPAEVEIELLDLGTLALPLYEPGLAAPPPEVRGFIDAIASADAMIWSSPVYHGSMSGAFKNALDWMQLLADAASPYLDDRPVGLIATSAGARSSPTLHAMATVVQALRGWSVPLTVGINEAHLAVGPDAEIRDPAIAAQLSRLGTLVADAAHRFAR